MASEGRQRSPPRESGSFVEKQRGKFWINAVIGAVAEFVVAMLPVINVIAPVAGGGVAGYLQNTGKSDGIKVGAVAGLLGAIPGIVVIFVVFSFLGLGVLSSGTGEGLAAGGVIGVVAIAVLAIVVVIAAALGALGGMIGASMAD